MARKIEQNIPANVYEDRLNLTIMRTALIILIKTFKINQISIIGQKLELFFVFLNSFLEFLSLFDQKN